MAKLYACRISSLGVRLLVPVHCHPLFAMSNVSLLPVVNVVVSDTLWGPSLVHPESTPPVGKASLEPVEEKRALLLFYHLH